MPFFQLQHRRGTAAQWAAANPILADGEFALESDTYLFKIGWNGNPWNLLPYGGIRGPAGTGAKGDQGIDGPTGPQGITGPQGNAGSQGVQGTAGPTGPQGITGPQGNAGSQGIQGTAGPTGPQGITGPQGNAGSQGIQGTAGPTGPQGITGPQGNAGNQGIQGTAGPTGPQGITGPQGVQGLQGTAGNTGPQGIPGIPDQFGNVARVDSVYGNDSIASIGGYAYKTLTAAVSAVIGPTGYTYMNPQNPGTTVWLLPGIYNIGPTGTNTVITDSLGATCYPLINFPSNCALRGMNIQTCTVQCSNPVQNTALINVGPSTRYEDISIVMGGAGYTGTNNLVGMYFGGNTAVTAKLRVSTLTICNSSIPVTASNDLYGIQFDGTGTLGSSTFSFNALKGSTINVFGNGNGKKRGIIVTNQNVSTVRDMNVYVAPPATYVTGSTGSYVGVETNDLNNLGSIQLRTTTVGTVSPTGPVGYYTSSDVLQTRPTGGTASPGYLATPGIQIGPGVDLVTKTAGGLPISTYIYPTTLFYGGLGAVNSAQKSGWLWNGTVLFTNSYPDTTVHGPTNDFPAFYKVQQPMIVCGLSVYCAAGSGTTNLTVTVYKNAIASGGVPSSGATSMTVTVYAGQLSAQWYGTTVNFAALDRLSVYMSAGDISWKDVSVQVDCF